MINTQHTPGPWIVTEVPGRDGEHRIETPRGLPLARLENYSPAERRCNAHLMAAAPDLLAALEKIAFECASYAACWETAQAALAVMKARGDKK